MAETADIEQEVVALLEAGEREEALALLTERHPAEIGGTLDELESAHAFALFDGLEHETRARVIPYVQSAHRLSLLERLDLNEQVRLLTDMDADERVDLYQEMPEDWQRRLMPALAKAEREDLLRLASYPEGTVGSVMTSEYAILPAQITSREAVERLRRQALHKETVNIAYVLGADRRLQGTVTLTGLVVAEDDVPVRDLMQQEVVQVHADEPRSEAARLIADYDLLAVPVVDADERMVGIVTHDDAMDVQEAEATEDIYKGATVRPLETGLRSTALSTLYQKRIGWLVLLVFANVFSGASIALHEETIQAHVGLVFFMPLLIASAGNTGAQSATLMIRAMATGEVVARDWLYMLVREIALGLALGLTMALAVAGIGLLRGGPDVALVVALTMVIVVLAGSLIGMSLPFLLERLRLDPATASTPLVTFVADVAGILVYFGMADLLLTMPAVTG